MMPEKLIEEEKQAASGVVQPPVGEEVTDSKKRFSTGRRFTFVFHNTPLIEAVRSITGDLDLSISMDSQIDHRTPVTVSLKDASFEETLDLIIVRSAGYAWSLKNGCLNIRRFREVTYHLDYLDMDGETEVEVGGDMLGSSVEEAGVTGLYQVKSKRSEKTKNVWNEIEEALNGFKSEGGILQLNRCAGIIYMADTPGRIDSMIRFLDSLSESLQRQVFIEAKIIEVHLKDKVEAGIDWSRLQVDFVSDSELLPSIFDISANSGSSVIRASQNRLSAILDFLRTQGDVSVLSNPHLSILNGQSAIMTVGYQYPYGDITGVDRDPETGWITYGTSIKRAVLGLQLGITPQISRDGIITMHIVPTITRIQGEQKVEIPTSSTTTHSISNPVIDLQEFVTTVRVREGETVLLAGLISQITQLDTEGLPFLQQIPLFGYLFKHLTDNSENKELVIVITPHIKEVGLSGGDGL
jgi:MSHA biogenesis protein MshL